MMPQPRTSSIIVLKELHFSILKVDHSSMNQFNKGIITMNIPDILNLESISTKWEI